MDILGLSIALLSNSRRHNLASTASHVIILLTIEFALTLWITPAIGKLGQLQPSAPYWSNPLFLISDIQTLRSASVGVPECQKLKIVG